ncbi:MAG: hypothetical protein AAF802_31035 [Planctomycetota bacterium]
MIGDRDVLCNTHCARLRSRRQRRRKLLFLQRLEKRQMLAADVVDFDQIIEPAEQQDFAVIVELADEAAKEISPQTTEDSISLDSDETRNNVQAEASARLGTGAPALPESQFASSSGSHADFFAALPETTDFIGPALQFDEQPKLLNLTDEATVEPQRVYGPSQVPFPIERNQPAESALEPSVYSDSPAGDIKPPSLVDLEEPVIVDMDLPVIAEFEPFAMEAETIGVQPESEASHNVPPKDLVEELEEPTLVEELQPTLSLAHESEQQQDVDSADVGLELANESRQNDVPMIAPVSLVSELELEFDVLELPSQSALDSQELRNGLTLQNEFAYFEDRFIETDASPFSMRSKQELANSMEHDPFIAMMIIHPRTSPDRSVAKRDTNVSTDFQSVTSVTDRGMSRLGKTASSVAHRQDERAVKRSSLEIKASKELIATREVIARCMKQAERESEPARHETREHHVPVPVESEPQPVENKPSHRAASAGLVAAVASFSLKQSREKKEKTRLRLN